MFLLLFIMPYTHQDKTNPAQALPGESGGIDLINLGKRYNREWIFRHVNYHFETGHEVEKVPCYRLSQEVYMLVKEHSHIPIFQKKPNLKQFINSLALPHLIWS